jgi:hypothetical protein
MRKVDTFAPHNDGHQWRKYGEKKINNTNFPRSERMDIYILSFCFVSSSFVPEKKICICPCFEKSTTTGKESTFISHNLLSLYSHLPHPNRPYRNIQTNLKKCLKPKEKLDLFMVISLTSLISSPTFAADTTTDAPTRTT